MPSLAKVKKTLTMRTAVLLALSALAACYAFHQFNLQREQAAVPAGSAAKLYETANYAITSTANEAQTKVVAEAVESLNAAYHALFSQSIRADRNRKKLLLTLYRDQAEFKAHNKAAFWAEAYYSPPACYAYYAVDEKNPYHWMLHEATHQLNNEVAHIAASKWINEGLATYFGTSSIRAGKLIPGAIDVHTYPIWGLARLSLSGDLAIDVRRGKIIDLRALISGVGGPSMDEKVNAYYFGYWSLTHFLFHFENGRYASKYRQLIAAGGSIENFERIVGPIDPIEGEWYGYLLQQVTVLKKAKLHSPILNRSRL